MSCNAFRPCSNPPVHGARIVAEVVGDEAVFNEWREEMEGMAGRIRVRKRAFLSKIRHCFLMTAVIRIPRSPHNCNHMVSKRST